MAEADPLRYPIGRFTRPALPLDPAISAGFIDDLERAPAGLRFLAGELTDAQLETTYRPGGWTIRQVVHHVPDSHMNGYVRMKLAATESEPAIKVYEEDRWAELPEARTAPVAMSLDLLDALHRRWVASLRALPADAFQKTFVHPQWGTVTIDFALAIYAWHGKHHTAHVKQALDAAPSR
jgi:hypothetical protein